MLSTVSLSRVLLNDQGDFWHVGVIHMLCGCANYHIIYLCSSTSIYYSDIHMEMGNQQLAEKPLKGNPGLL
jgi:hypothetical protein